MKLLIKCSASHLTVAIITFCFHTRGLKIIKKSLFDKLFYETVINCIVCQLRP